MGDQFNGDVDTYASDFLSMPIITLLAEEGSRTVAKQRIGQSGAEDFGHVLSLEIQVGDPVVVEPTLDLTVKRRVAGAGAQTIVGFATTKSSPLEGVEIPGLLTAGVVADPEMYQVTVEVLGSFFRVVTLDDDGVAVVPGDGVKLSATQVAEWTKGTANNGTLVMTLADDDEAFGVILGHDGVFS